MSRTILAIVLVFMLALSAESQSAIRGRVTDSEGAVIAKACVFLHRDPSSPASDSKKNSNDFVSVLTDSSGEYTLTVPAGFYDVFVSAPVFTPIAAKVIVKNHQPVKFDAKLYVDAQVSKEIGGMGVESASPK